MATPHIAGVIALIRSANKTLTPAQIRDLIKNTATPLTPNDLNQYGAGMVNAQAAVAGAMAMAPAFKIAR
jgi:subtilisin family serine protease